MAKPPAPHPATDVRPALTPRPAPVAEPPAVKTAEAERLAQERAEAERQAKARADRLAKAEADRLAKAEADRRAKPTAVTESFGQRSPRARTPDGTIWAVLILAVLLVGGLIIWIAHALLFSTPTP